MLTLELYTYGAGQYLVQFLYVICTIIQILTIRMFINASLEHIVCTRIEVNTMKIVVKLLPTHMYRDMYCSIVNI